MTDLPTHPPVDNVLLRNAIAAFAAQPSEPRYLEALRQVFQGEILFDITGSDVRTGDGMIAAGSTFTVHIGTRDLPDGGTESMLFAYTRQEEAQRMHPDTPAQTLGQPCADLFASAKAMGADSVIVDQAGPAIRFDVNELQFLDLPRNDALKAALGSDDGVAKFETLRRNGPLLYAVGEDERVLMSRSQDGQPVLMAFTSGPEAFVLAPRARVVPVDVRRAVDDGLSKAPGGVVINPAGPYLHLDHAMLGRLWDELKGLS